jgi:NADPH-dependent 2,4-dienoyl-CoA reductase/sulfur reductase-like enzyme
MAESMTERRIVVVGAGPAGIRCAEALVKAGIRPLMIDEGLRSGGQIYRRQPENFTRSAKDLYGSEAEKATDIHKSFDALLKNIDYWPESLIWNISGETLYVVSGNKQSTVTFSGLIICAGATDRLLPTEGWHRAGCYSLGGSQVALKSQACSIGRKVVFMGTGPLLYLVSFQYVKAGAKVAAVVDTSPFSLRIKALPWLLANPIALFNGLLLTANLMLAGVKIFSGAKPVAVEGEDENGVSGFRFLDKAGREQQIPCDAVAMGYHLRPETQLADLARCEFNFDQQTRQWLPVIDDDGRSSMDDIYLAGDGARILGADAAERSGELAALALLKDQGYQVDSSRVFELRRQLAALRRFALGLSKAFPWPYKLAEKLSDSTVVCRCEAVTVGDLRNTLTQTGAREANRAKAFSRVGMGRCQGRFCANSGAEIIAASTGVQIQEAGRLRGQGPVKPLPLALIAEERV